VSCLVSRRGDLDLPFESLPVGVGSETASWAHPRPDSASIRLGSPRRAPGPHRHRGQPTSTAVSVTRWTPSEAGEERSWPRWPTDAQCATMWHTTRLDAGTYAIRHARTMHTLGPRVDVRRCLSRVRVIGGVRRAQTSGLGARASTTAGPAPRCRPDRVLADKAYTSAANAGSSPTEASRSPSPNAKTKRQDVHVEARAVAAHAALTRRPTDAETSSNAASTVSSSGEASPPAATRQRVLPRRNHPRRRAHLGKVTTFTNTHLRGDRLSHGASSTSA
jgi:hypothetical protein